MMKKRRRMMKTLTFEWNQAVERPRPGTMVGSKTFVQVKLSNRELIHSLGISYTGNREEKVAGLLMWKKQTNQGQGHNPHLNECISHRIELINLVNPLKLLCQSQTDQPTSPAINCPKPGGNVKVAIMRVTTPG